MKIVICDCYYESFDQEKAVFTALGSAFYKYDCRTEDEVIAVASDCDALVCQSAPITAKVIDSLTKCKIIVRYGIGYDNIDWKFAEKKGIYVCNCPDYCIDEVSNHAIALMLDCSRKITYLAGQIKLGNAGYKVIEPVIRTRGKILGLVGFGKIARLVARKMSGFDMEIISYDPYMSRNVFKQFGVRQVSFDELLKESDFISVHCYLNDETKHMFNYQAFKKMKNTCVFVNTARGGLVDEKALIRALENKQIGMAGIDVTEAEPIETDNPLLYLDNAVVTSHMAWYSVESKQELQLNVAQEVERVMKGEKPRNPVNNPV